MQPWSRGEGRSRCWSTSSIPVIVIGTRGTAGMIRRLRANLLDELQKQYVVTARAKGLPPVQGLLKYPLRMAINPFIADIGNLLPQLISGLGAGLGRAVAADHGPMLLDALKSQDMYLAGSLLMFVALLTVVGMLISDLAAGVRSIRASGFEGGAQTDDAPERLDHYVNPPHPFDPDAAEHMTPEQERFYTASQWRLMWWKFKRHRLAVAVGAILAFMYFYDR